MKAFSFNTENVRKSQDKLNHFFEKSTVLYLMKQ